MRYFDPVEGWERRTLNEFFLPWEGYPEVLLQETPVSHFHSWVPCEHKGVESIGSNPKCSEISPYLTQKHQVCLHCGVERWPSQWGETVRKILERRRAAAER